MSDPSRSFGVDPAAYERGRPVVDVAAGTGKLTRLLARRFAHAIAIEPDDAMRALIGTDDVRRGTAEAIPLAYFASISPVTSLPPDERLRAADRIEAALDRPSYLRRWTAELDWTRRT